MYTNILLDRLPTDYDGYLIRTSFRIGIQICLCLQDVDLDERERLYTALSLLYGNGIPTDQETAINGLNWFMSAGAEQPKTGGDNKTLFYWDFDSSRIFSSFRQSYGIDLAHRDMHWFEFISLMGSLDRHSALSEAIAIRTYDMSDLKGKARTEMQKMKSNLTPPVQLTQEEKDKLAAFDALFDGGDVNG